MEQNDFIIFGLLSEFCLYELFGIKQFTKEHGLLGKIFGSFLCLMGFGSFSNVIAKILINQISFFLFFINLTTVFWTLANFISLFGIITIYYGKQIIIVKKINLIFLLLISSVTISILIAPNALIADSQSISGFRIEQSFGAYLLCIFIFIFSMDFYYSRKIIRSISEDLFNYFILIIISVYILLVALLITILAGMHILAINFVFVGLFFGILTPVFFIFVHISKIERNLEENGSIFVLSQEGLFHLNKVEMIGLTATKLSHDIKNELQIIISASELLRLKIKENEKLNLIDKIHDSALRSSELAQGIVNKIRVSPTLEDFIDLNGEIRSNLILPESLREAYNVDFEIKLNLQENLPKIKISRTHLNQILLNLLKNAVESIEMKNQNVSSTTIQGGLKRDFIEISTSWDERNNQIMMEIKDSGVGFNKKQKSKMASHLYTTKSSRNGTGLGLIIVKQLLNQYNCRFEFSGEPGNGATFRIFWEID